MEFLVNLIAVLGEGILILGKMIFILPFHLIGEGIGYSILGLFMLSFEAWIAYLIYDAVFEHFDTLSQPIKKGLATIIDKTHIPAIPYYLPPFMLPMRVPGNWIVQVKINDQISDAYVSKDQFKKLSENQKIEVEYVTGKFSGKLYVADFS